MPDYDLALRSTRVVTPDGEHPAVVLVADGRIAALAPHDADTDPHRTVELGTDALLPGVVDMHVHVNEPGWTEYEGFATATAAAAAGGVTTIVDMPNSSLPPTTTVDALEVKRAAARGQCHVDVGFWGGAVANNRKHLAPLLEAGVLGFKGYLIPETDQFRHLTPADLWDVLAELRTLDGLLIVHAEDAEVVAAAPAPGGPRFADYAASRPDTAEVVAVTRLVEASRMTGTRTHVVHLAAAAALPVLRAARRDGVPITAETCPHYLTFAAETVPDGATPFACTPPIRSGADRELLWAALAEGTVDCVVSDHAPCTVAAKHLDTGDFARADPGVSSLQVALAATWTGVARRGHGLAELARWTATRTARIAGLSGKGAIAVGRDADLVRFDPDAHTVVDQEALRHRNKLTAYHGLTLRGAVRDTWLRGVRVAGEPAGELLVRDGRAA